ncbi:rhomboid family protein [Ceratobasidium sp. AG-Ba]|nr:rhomboid family protein [Ceratobasidium sp. AG-Ba]QRW01629.1 rhomboid family protein [Ceratobasidium sp. AG-Ba]
MVLTGSLSLIAGLADVRYYFHLQLAPHISRDHQYWRLITNQLAFTNSSELFLSQLLFYSVAVGIERTFGSLKYTSFLLASALVSTLLNFITLLLLHRIGVNYIPSGPIPILFSILYQYHRIVPSAYTFRIFGVPVTNKIFTYLTALPIIISYTPGSILAAFNGLSTGALYRSGLTDLKSFRVSPWVVSAISSLVGSSRSPHISARAIPGERAPFASELVVTRRRTTGTVQEEASGAAAAATGDTGATGGSVMREWVDELTGRRDSGRVPTAAEIAELTAVFPHASREEIVDALQRSQTVDQAASVLLTRSS